VDALLKTPQNLPGLYLIYQGAHFGAGPVAMGTTTVSSDMSLQILLIVNSLKSPHDAALSAWTIMEAVRSRLIGRQILTYNKLWPQSEDLVFSEGGLLVYGMNYILEDARI
jgi:hypothetical protein